MLLDLDLLSETCYNHSRKVERDLYLKKMSPSDIFPTENCFGWTYFESAFILSIVQIVLAFLSSFLAGYILITVRVRSHFTVTLTLNSFSNKEILLDILSDTGEDSKLVHRRICTKVDASIFLTFPRRVRATSMTQRRVENTRVHFGANSPVDKFRVLACIGLS